MEADHDPQLLVASALQPVRYRVYPGTPLSEVVDLIVRRQVRALPVVGESFEVLGIITAGDALSQVLRDRPDGAGGAPRPELVARDVMTRSVLCVAETQSLVDAAQMMVNRDVEQLPVVREGQLIGLLTREAILAVLHLGTNDDNENEGDS